MADGYGDPDQPGLFCGSLPPGQVANDDDNCPSVDDPDLSDQDGDGLGPGCDPDEDGDGVADWLDLCPWIADPLQRDLDGDGTGDLCDDDRDGDGADRITDRDDLDALHQEFGHFFADLDGDGLGDPHVDLWACLDVPPPGWVADQRDTCPEDAGADPQDSDQDGLGDACDVGDGGCVCQSGATGPAGMLLVLPLGWVVWGRRAEERG